MAYGEPETDRKRLAVARVLDLLLHPDATWDEIDEEPATIRGLFSSYVLPMALIGPVCGFIGRSLTGVEIYGVIFRPNPGWLALQALVSLGLTLGLVYALSVLIAELAPRYGGERDRVQAFKLAAYGATPSFVGGVFALVPQLGLAALLAALYSLYLLYRGLPRLVRTPEFGAKRYIGIVLVSAVGCALVVGGGGAAVLALATPNDLGDLRHMSGKVELPGRGTVDLDRLQAEVRKLDAAAKRMEAGQSIAVTADTLKPLLPPTVDGFTRGEVRGETGGVAGAQGSRAEADYTQGLARIELQVTDLGDAGAIAGLASAFDVRSDRKTGSGHERITKVDGRLVREVYDAGRRRGEYSVLVAERFLVRAKGERVTMPQLRALAGAVDAGQLEAMAKGS